MNALLWVLQVLLAVAFLAHGWLYLSPPPEMVVPLQFIPDALRLFIGVAEVAAAIGLTLPGITRLYPWVISWAAAGLMILMASAATLHASRGEWSSVLTTMILFALLAFVGYMRWKLYPIRPRMVA